MTTALEIERFSLEMARALSRDGAVGLNISTNDSVKTKVNERWSRQKDLGHRFSAAPSSGIEIVDDALATVNRLCSSVRVAAGLLSSPIATAQPLDSWPSCFQPTGYPTRVHWGSYSRTLNCHCRMPSQMTGRLPAKRLQGNAHGHRSFLQAFTNNLRLAAELPQSE